MYSTSRDERIGDLVDKDIMTIAETTLISDSARIMKKKAYHPYLLPPSEVWHYGAEEEEMRSLISYHDQYLIG